jgi:hypothetical protein
VRGRCRRVLMVVDAVVDVVVLMVFVVVVL